MIDKKLKDFATLVKKMRVMQKDYQRYIDVLIAAGSLDCEEARDYLSKSKAKRKYEEQVDRWLEELL